MDNKNNFQKVIKSLINGEAAAIIGPVAEALADKIKTATPRLTGTLADSIKSAPHSKFGHTIKTAVPYAIFVEYGTEDTPAAASFRRTFDLNAVSMATELEKEFKNHIETAAQ